MKDTSLILKVIGIDINKITKYNCTSFSSHRTKYNPLTRENILF